MRQHGRMHPFSAAVALLTVLMALVPTTTLASTDEEVGTSPAAFLEIPIGATSSVVPEIVAGMRPDGAMLFANPSNLGDVQRRELYFTTSNWLGEFNLSAATMSLPVEPMGLTWSLGARLLYSGDLRGYDAAGAVVAEENYYDMALTTGFGKRFDSLGLAFGAGVTYIREHLAVEDGNAVTYTAGLSYALRGHRLEFIAQDLGGALEFDDRSYDIDPRYIVGYGYLMQQHWGIIGVGTQAMFARGKLSRIDAGVSYDPNRFLTLRTGMGHTAETTANTKVPITAGMSVHMGDVSLDYAFTPRQYFSDTHTFAIRFAFGGFHSHLDEPTPELTAPVFSSSPAAAPTQSQGAGNQTYTIVAGAHSRVESAEAEARALLLLKIPAVVEQSGDQYQVVIERFDTREAAVAALRSLRNRGHRFSIVVH